MNFQVTVLKILVSYPDGFAVMADLKRDMAILAKAAATGPNARSDSPRACRTSTSSPKAWSSAKAAVGRSPRRGARCWNSLRLALGPTSCPMRLQSRPLLRQCLPSRNRRIGRSGGANAASVGGRRANELGQTLPNVAMCCGAASPTIRPPFADSTENSCRNLGNFPALEARTRRLGEARNWYASQMTHEPIYGLRSSLPPGARTGRARR